MARSGRRRRPGPIGPKPESVITSDMSVLSTHLRGPGGRAARLAVGAALMLAIGAAVLVAVRTLPALRGPGGDRPGRTAGDAGAIGSSTAGDATGEGVERSSGPQAEGDEGGRPDAGQPDPAGPELARDRDAGEAGDGGRRRAPGAEQVLAFLDEVERHVGQAMDRARESVVALEYTAGHAAAGHRRIASGVVINSRGDILSVRIDPPRPAPSGGGVGQKGQGPVPVPSPIVARDYLGRRHVARWLAADPHTGLTLLRVSPRAVRPIRAAADGPKLGSQVFVLGNPFGMGHSVNRGHVAGLDRVLELGDQRLGGLIQVQAPLYPGDSGAAVVDVRGGWMGLIRGGLAPPGPDGPAPAAGDGKPAEGAADGDADTDFGFAITTRDALWIAEQLRAHGRVERAYLGVRLETMGASEAPMSAPEAGPPVQAQAPSPASSGGWRRATVAGAPGPAEATLPSPAESEPAPAPGDGARIFEVLAGSPAAEAGLRSGDRIVALDGRRIRSHDDLIDRLDRILARKAIVLGVVREGEPGRSRFEVTVRTASRPDPPTAAPVAGQGASSEPRSTGAGVPVTPTASRTEPAPAGPESAAPPPGPGGSNPAPPIPAEARPAPGAAPTSGDPPPATVKRDAAPSPAIALAPPPDRPEPVPTASGAPGSFNELKLTLPRAVVERIEHLERRIDELEHVRSGAERGREGQRHPPSPSAAPGRSGERPGPRPGPSGR